MIYKIKQLYLKYKYKKAKSLYIIGLWASYGILECRWSGKIDKEGNPLTIYYTDCNGEKELYYITQWYHETTGRVFGYSFNKEQAESLVERLKNERNSLY